jgi:hypothetical protein
MQSAPIVLCSSSITKQELLTRHTAHIMMHEAVIDVRACVVLQACTSCTVMPTLLCPLSTLLLLDLLQYFQCKPAIKYNFNGPVNGPLPFEDSEHSSNTTFASSAQLPVLNISYCPRILHCQKPE